MLDPAKFRARRDALGMTQQALASAAGMSFSAVRNLESTAGPGTAYETVVRIARVLGRSPAWFHRDGEGES